MRWRVPAGVSASVGDQVEPALRGGAVAGAPGGEREQFARGVAERPVGRGQRLEPRAQLGERRGIDQNEPGADRREILQRAADAGVGGERVVGFTAARRIGLGELGGLAEARQHAVAGRAVLGDLGEGCLRLGLLAGFGERRPRPRRRRRTRRPSWRLHHS